ncbi:uncharacterized protein LOC106637571 isoform X1 [Copidosoma floridanum]|uniref:uncharacterized protein LOC106637571 isoform X1 n=1 Tax=Copidosoma floridanum TaxID=29053 RepID=UPI0006C9B6FF|nr:uncharacterized protein LOC106637571 isoform X1 [Copidosoma floridanum]
MAGIFSIFSELENAPPTPNSRGKENSRSKFFGSVEVLTTKSIQPQIKPKGLSIRSKSDLNVSTLNSVGANRLNSKDCHVAKEKQCLSSKSVSPLKLLTPKKKIENYANKKLSPKISSPLTQNVPDEFVFKKPATPQATKKATYPEPEKMSYYYDPVKYISEITENEFQHDALLFKSLHKSNDSIELNEEDSGFLSDSGFESFDYSVTPSPPLLPSFSSIELPEISDCED